MITYRGLRPSTRAKPSWLLVNFPFRCNYVVGQVAGTNARGLGRSWNSVTIVPCPWEATLYLRFRPANVNQQPSPGEGKWDVPVMAYKTISFGWGAQPRRIRFYAGKTSQQYAKKIKYSVSKAVKIIWIDFSLNSLSIRFWLCRMASSGI
jgi:hypothetical protein